MGMEKQRQEKKDRFVVSCKILMAFKMPNLVKKKKKKQVERTKTIRRQ
jgi:hypothetical protein